MAEGRRTSVGGARRGSISPDPEVRSEPVGGQEEGESEINIAPPAPRGRRRSSVGPGIGGKQLTMSESVIGQGEKPPAPRGRRRSSVAQGLGTGRRRGSVAQLRGGKNASKMSLSGGKKASRLNVAGGKRGKSPLKLNRKQKVLLTAAKTTVAPNLGGL